MTQFLSRQKSQSISVGEQSVADRLSQIGLYFYLKDDDVLVVRSDVGNELQGLGPFTEK